MTALVCLAIQFFGVCGALVGAPNDPPPEPVNQWTTADFPDITGDWRQRPPRHKAGTQLFRQVSCHKCHRFNGEGNEYGPDLTQWSQPWTPRTLLQQIIEPSAKLHRDFRSHVFHLKSGETLSGLIVAAGRKHLRVVDDPIRRSQPRRILLEDIERQSKSTISLMPTGMLNSLTREQVLDLLAYVYSKGDDRHTIYEESQRVED